ncbi:MAG TPA: SDR family NAD(P)-dependent oxidoreductase [Magnetospirillaceae bacterium]
MTKTALIIGATGGIGGAVARVLLAKGWSVRALHRDPAKAAQTVQGLPGIDWVKGDAMSRNDVVASAQGAQIIMHGANPPGYKNWRGLAAPMLANTIEAALLTGARILFPGTVYNYGPDAGTLVSEGAPQNPLTRKGKIRLHMEEMLRAAAEQFGVKSIVLRAGDYLGGPSNNTWFRAGMVKPGKPIRSVTYPGQRDTGHAFAYLPDLAEAFARLAEREHELAEFETFHFGGQWCEQGVEIAHAVRRAVGNDRLPIRSFPWIAIYALAPFNETFREMLEMRYLWKRPLRLDNRKLVAFLGGEPHTHLDEAVRATLSDLGCLGGGPVAGAMAAGLA